MTQRPQPRGPEEKLTIAEVCAELKISRSTFYDWRAKRRGSALYHLAQRKPAGSAARPGPLAWYSRRRGLMETTYDVRVYKTEAYRGARVSSYRVRWKTAGQDWRRTFRNKAQADVFRGELLAAARKGEAFSQDTGEPMSWRRAGRSTSWYDFACAYVDMKWTTASAKYRRAIAQALAAATPPMLVDSHDRPHDQALRGALVNWAYNSKHRATAPEEVEDVLSWLRRNTREVKDLADPAVSRRLLAAVTSRLDGTRAASTSVRRNRAVLLNTLDYAVELGLLDSKPGQEHQMAGAQDDSGSRSRRCRQSLPGAGPSRSRAGSEAQWPPAGRVLRSSLLQRAAS